MGENGYSCVPTIGLISEEVVAEIERDTGNNLRDVIDSLDCSNAETYKRQTSFKFLPGHRRFILNLPTDIEKMKESMSSNTRANIPARNKRKRPTTNGLANQMNAESNLSPQSIAHTLDINHGTVEIDKEDGVNTDAHDSTIKMLKLELVKKLRNRGINAGCEWEKSLTEDLIIEIEINIDLNGEVNNGKCRFLCPICALKYSCNYDRYC